MALSLSDLQDQFSKALHYKATGESCGFVSDVFSADERVQIYRNNFIMSLSEVLEATYPKVLALVGIDCFQQIARQHVLTHPLTQGDVSSYGEGFSRTIRQFDSVISTVPYLPDVADMEWKLDLCEMALSLIHEETYYPLDQLASITEEQQNYLVFHFSPNVQFISSQFALFSLWDAIENESFNGLDLTTPEQGVLRLDSSRHLHLERISSEVGQLIHSLLKGLALEEIDAQLLKHLNTLMASGYLDGFSLKNHSSEEVL